MEIIPAELLQDIVRRLVAEFDPDQIILFGSHAWGKPDADNDLDLFIAVVPFTRPAADLSPVGRGADGLAFP